MFSGGHRVSDGFLRNSDPGVREAEGVLDKYMVKPRARPGRARLGDDSLKWRSETNLVIPSVRPMSRHLAQYGLIALKRDVEVQTDVSPRATETCAVQTERPHSFHIGVQTMNASESYVMQFVDYLLESQRLSPDGDTIVSTQPSQPINTEPPDLLMHHPAQDMSKSHSGRSQHEENGVLSLTSSISLPENFCPSVTKTCTNSSDSTFDIWCKSTNPAYFNGRNTEECSYNMKLSPLSPSDKPTDMRQEIDEFFIEDSSSGTFYSNSKDLTNSGIQMTCVSTAVLNLVNPERKQNRVSDSKLFKDGSPTTDFIRKSNARGTKSLSDSFVNYEKDGNLLYNAEALSKSNRTEKHLRKETVDDRHKDFPSDLWSESLRSKSWKDLINMEEEIIRSLQLEEISQSDRDEDSELFPSTKAFPSPPSLTESLCDNSQERQSAKDTFGTRSQARYGLSPVREEQEQTTDKGLFMGPPSYSQNLDVGFDLSFKETSNVILPDSVFLQTSVVNKDALDVEDYSKTIKEISEPIANGRKASTEVFIPESTQNFNFERDVLQNMETKDLSQPPGSSILEETERVVSPYENNQDLEGSNVFRPSGGESFVNNEQCLPKESVQEQTVACCSNTRSGRESFNSMDASRERSPRHSSTGSNRYSTSSLGGKDYRQASDKASCEEELQPDGDINAAEILERIQREVGRMTEEVHSADFDEMLYAVSPEEVASAPKNSTPDRQEHLLLQAQTKDPPVSKRNEIDTSAPSPRESPEVCNAGIDGPQEPENQPVAMVFRNVIGAGEQTTILCVGGHRQAVPVHSNQETLRCLIVSPPPPLISPSPPPLAPMLSPHPSRPPLPICIPPPPPPLPMSIPPPPSSSPLLPSLGRFPIHDKRQQWLKSFALEELQQKVKIRQRRLLKEREDIDRLEETKNGENPHENIEMPNDIQSYDTPNNVTHDGVSSQVNIRPQDSVKETLPDPHQQSYNQIPRNDINSSNDPYPTYIRRIEDGDRIPDDAVLVDKKVTVEGDKIHTDSYYALPVQSETVTTTTTKPAQKYEGIGPTTVEGIPVCLRTGVKEEHASDWYKSMFKSLHKAARNEDRFFHSGGYVSEPDLSLRGHSPVPPPTVAAQSKKPAQNGPDKGNLLKVNNDELNKIRSSSSEELGRSKYNVPLRPISEYEPGYSSIVEREALMRTKHIKPTDKPFFLGTDGYDSDSTVIKKSGRKNLIAPEKQKALYREIQRGGDIPITGLCMPAPQKPSVYAVGPPPSIFREMSEHMEQIIRRPEQPPPPDDTRNNFSNHLYNNQANLPSHYYNGKNQKESQDLPERIPTLLPSHQPQGDKKKQEKSVSPDQETIARVLFDFKPQNTRELILQKGEIVKILRQLDKNWYEGAKESKVGIFPVTYVEIVPPEYNRPPTPPEPLECKARAKYDFPAQTSVELPLKKGDIVTLLRQVDKNWFEGMVGIKKGIFPISYAEVLDSSSNQVTPSESPSPSVNGSSLLMKNCRSQPLTPEPMPTVTNLPPKPLPSVNLPPPVCEETQPPANQTTSHDERDAVQTILFRALYPYSPQNGDELELQEGDTISVIKMCDDGWYVGTSNRTGLFGTFPGNYTEKV